MTTAPAATAPSPSPAKEPEPARIQEEAARPPSAQEEPVQAAAEPVTSPGAARGWLGVELEPAGPSEPGVRVGRVVRRSPAEKAGMLAGDLIVRLDDQPVTGPGDVVGVVSSRGAGARLGVALKRGTADHLVAVTLGGFPERDDLYRMSFVDLPAPSFELLRTAKGNFTPTLNAQRGKVLLVEFWAPWCVACRALIPHMNQMHAQYAARGLSVVGITADPVPRAANAASELGMEYPIASDETGKTTRAYEARAIPAVFIIDRRGTVRDVMVGYDPRRITQFDLLVQRLLAEK